METVELSSGWGVLHLFYKVDRERATREPGSTKRVIDAIASLEADGHQALVFAVLGHKADLLNVGYGQRYYYAPQVLLSLTLLGLTRNRQPVPRYLAWTLVTWLLVVGAWQYFQVIPAMAAGPSWYDQIVLWRDRPDRAIYLWPPSIIIPLPRA